MSPKHEVVFVLLAGLISTTALAYASPPDPTWIEAIHDDADGDDVIVSLTGATWVVDLDPLRCLTVIFVTTPFVAQDEPQRIPTPVEPFSPGRAPPLA
jgi:hypothetical protein